MAIRVDIEYIYKNSMSNKDDSFNYRYSTQDKKGRNKMAIHSPIPFLRRTYA